MAARCDKERRDSAYRFYITDALKVIGGLNIRYADIIRKTPAKKADPKEIISRLSAGLDALREGDDVNELT